MKKNEKSKKQKNKKERGYQSTLGDIPYLYWNVDGIGDMLGDPDVLSYLRKFKICVLAETKKGPSYKPKIPGYQTFPHPRNFKHPRSKRYDGGMIVFVADDIISSVKIDPVLEHLIWVSIKKKHHLAFIYMPPPSKSLDTRPTPDYIETLRNELISKKSKGFIYLCGDGNCRTGSLPDFFSDVSDEDSSYMPLTSVRLNCDNKINPRGRQFIESICKYTGIQILNGRAPFQNTNCFTCHKWNGKSLIDLLLAQPECADFITNFMIDKRRPESDHNPLIFNLTDKSLVKNEKRKTKNFGPYRYTWRNDKKEDYINSLDDEDVVKNLQFFMCSMVDHKGESDPVVDNFYSCLDGAIKKNFKKSAAKPRSNFPTNDWFDDELKAQKRSLHDAIENNANLEEERSLRKKYRATRQRKKRASKFKKVTKFDNMASNNPNDFWKFWKNYKNSNREYNSQIDIETFSEFYNQGKIESSNEVLSSIEEVVSNDCFGESPLCNTWESDVINDIMNGPVLSNEIHLALYKAKTKKSPGIDGISVEFFKYSDGKLIHPLSALFNHVLESGIYPSQWSLGIINPIYKHSEKHLPDNYRKVTLLTSIGKLFESVMNNRLTYCKEVLNTNDPFQNGFKSDARAIDNTFILNGIIEKYNALKRPLFVAFIDFKSAFDKVNRLALLFKMSGQGMHGKFLKIVKSMLGKAKSQVKWNFELGEIFDNLNGVLQGGVISPTLFNLFLEDLPRYLGQDYGIKIGNMLVNYLLHADDLVLMAETQAGLQQLLDRLNKFCKRWDMIINASKTKIMIFNTKHIFVKDIDKTSFFLDNSEIKHAEKYKYLGTMISNVSNDPFEMNYSYLRGKALRAIAALRHDVKQALGFRLPIKLLFKSFDAQIRPIADYGCELWCSNNGIHDIEYTQNFFIKTSLCLRDSTPTPAILGETGRYPLYLKQHELLLRYLNRFEKMDKSRVLYKTFQELKDLDTEGHTTWFTKSQVIKNMYYNTNESINTLDSSAIYQIYSRRWLQNINDHKKHPKLRTYKTFKKVFEPESYLSSSYNWNHIIALARFRTGAHNLNIEKGRHTKPITPLHNRTCLFCQSSNVDDEFHFLMSCSFHSENRKHLFESINYDIPGFHHMNDQDRFTNIMSMRSYDTLKFIARYVFDCFKHRESQSQILALQL